MAPTPPSAAFGEASYHRLFDLAQGGMGRVELVVRSEGTFKRLYAVKRLLEGLRSDEAVRQAFLDEARIAGLVRHPNVVPVLDVGEDERGPYLVMDYVEGVSVADLMRASVRARRQVPLQVCLRIVAQAAEGLHAAHMLTGEDGASLKLVHRDVSPPNILVGFDGIVRVTDFGVAKALGRLSHTHGAVLKGKLGYMSPEQLRFEPIDHRSDLFALGVVLFEMLAGRRLYRNKEETEGTRRLLAEPPPDIGEERDDAPPALVQLLFSMLAKKAEHRPSTAREVRKRLEEMVAALVAEEGPIEVAEFLAATMSKDQEEQAARITHAMSDVGERQKTAVRRRWPLVVATGVAVAVVAVLVAKSAPEPAPPPPPPPPPVSAALPPPPVEPPPAVEPQPEVEEPAPPKRTKRRRKKTKPKREDGVPMWEWE
ncbi:MAG: serine/threonine-protein kinase [Deltaproteobacteria bacterium]